MHYQLTWNFLIVFSWAMFSWTIILTLFCMQDCDCSNFFTRQLISKNVSKSDTTEKILWRKHKTAQTCACLSTTLTFYQPVTHPLLIGITDPCNKYRSGATFSVCYYSVLCAKLFICVFRQLKYNMNHYCFKQHWLDPSQRHWQPYYWILTCWHGSKFLFACLKHRIK